MQYEIVTLVLLALWLFCLVDVIMTPEDQVRNLPKIVWLFVVVLLLDIGSILWLIAGRPWNRSTSYRGRYEGARPTGFPEYERPGRAVGSSPESDAEFLRHCRERAEAQRAEYQRRKTAEGSADS